MSGQSKPTPGPWRMRRRSDDWIIERPMDTEPGYFVASVPDHNGYGENEANAHLIRTAPDMLAALKDARSGLRVAIAVIVDSGGQADWPDSTPRKALASVEAAIAKARGES